MKIRSGFVSNSSSSSFIVKGKENIKKAIEAIENGYDSDYVIVGKKLFTSPIADESPECKVLDEVKFADTYMQWNGPLDDENFVCMTGEYRGNSVYVQKSEVGFMFKVRRFCKLVKKAFRESFIAKYYDYDEDGW